MSQIVVGINKIDTFGPHSILYLPFEVIDLKIELESPDKQHWSNKGILALWSKANHENVSIIIILSSFSMINQV